VKKKATTKIICVTEVPESGSSPVTWFVDIRAMKADADPICQKYVAAIETALKDPNKLAVSDFICYDQVTDKYTVSSRCQLRGSVTLHEM